MSGLGIRGLATGKRLASDWLLVSAAGAWRSRTERRLCLVPVPGACRLAGSVSRSGQGHAPCGRMKLVSSRPGHMWLCEGGGDGGGDEEASEEKRAGGGRVSAVQVKGAGREWVEHRALCVVLDGWTVGGRRMRVVPDRQPAESWETGRADECEQSITHCQFTGQRPTPQGGHGRRVGAGCACGAGRAWRLCLSAWPRRTSAQGAPYADPESQSAKPALFARSSPAPLSPSHPTHPSAL